MNVNEITEIMQRAKYYVDNRDYYLFYYLFDIEYDLLNEALDKMVSAYHRCVQGILGTTIVGKPPVNAFTAAGIGNAIGGIYGALSMGVTAANEQIKYEERLEQFKKDYKALTNSGLQLKFLVDTADQITSRQPQPIYPDDFREIYYQKIKKISEGRILTTPTTQHAIKIAKELSGYKDFEEIYNRLNNTYTKNKFEEDLIALMNESIEHKFPISEKEMKYIDYFRNMPDISEHKEVVYVLRQTKRRNAIEMIICFVGFPLLVAAPLLSIMISPKILVSLITTLFGIGALRDHNSYNSIKEPSEYVNKDRVFRILGIAGLIISILLIIIIIIKH